MYNIDWYAEHIAIVKVHLWVCRSIYKRRESSDGGMRRKEKKKRKGFVGDEILGIETKLTNNCCIQISCNFLKQKLFYVQSPS